MGKRNRPQQTAAAAAAGTKQKMSKKRKNGIARQKAEIHDRIKKLKREGKGDNDHNVVALKAQLRALS